MTDLLALAVRCEGAEGSSRELDALIAVAVGFSKVIQGWAYNADNRATMLLAYSGSLDAAMGLVPEGWHVNNFRQHWRSLKWVCDLARLPSAGQIRAYDSGKTIGGESQGSEAATAALAITGACLRARAAQDASQ